jgi:hypothetical protein
VTVCPWCASFAGSMRKDPARSATRASMLSPLASTRCSPGFSPPPPNRCECSDRRLRTQPCYSPLSRGSPYKPPRRSCRSARWPCIGPRKRPSPPCASSWWGRVEAPSGFLPGPWQEPEDPSPSGSMNPLLRLLGAAASNGLLTGQIVFSTAFVGACELPNWIQAPREVNACLERWMTVSALFFPSGMQTAIAKTQPALPPGRRGMFR